jgi:hypothetical protein
LRIALFDQYRLEQARSGKDSKKASRYAMVVWSLDADTPSSSYAADYLLDAAIRAGVSLDDLRSVLERNIPGLSAAIAQRGGL